MVVIYIEKFKVEILVRSELWGSLFIGALFMYHQYL